MEIIKIKKQNTGSNWAIYIEGFNKKNYLNFVGFIKKLGLERNIKTEKKIWKLCGKIKGNWINRIYQKIQYTYIEKTQQIAITWKNPMLTGKEMVSMYLSYLKK